MAKTYTVVDNSQNWDDLAAELGVSAAQLRTWNKSVKALSRGTVLTIPSGPKGNGPNAPKATVPVQTRPLGSNVAGGNAVVPPVQPVVATTQTPWGKAGFATYQQWQNAGKPAPRPQAQPLAQNVAGGNAIRPPAGTNQNAAPILGSNVAGGNAVKPPAAQPQAPLFGSPWASSGLVSGFDIPEVFGNPAFGTTVYNKPNMKPAPVQPPAQTYQTYIPNFNVAPPIDQAEYDLSWSLFERMAETAPTSPMPGDWYPLASGGTVDYSVPELPGGGGGGGGSGSFDWSNWGSGGGGGGGWSVPPDTRFANGLINWRI
jgi:hypothetical protein